MDASGNAYVVGNTRSTNFPTTVGAHDRTHGGEGDEGIGDAFVTKIGSTGGSLVYSTYLGAAGDESATGIGLTSTNEAYVTGRTTSTGFPLVAPIVRFHFHLGDVFVARLNASGGALSFSSYFGSTGDDQANGIAVDGTDAAYVGGFASSDDFPWSNEAFDRACEADTPDDFCSGDGFVMKIAPAAMSDMCPPGTSLTGAADPQQVIVKFRRGSDRRERTAALRAEGLERIRELPLVGAEVVRGPGRSAVAIARALERRADVEYVTLDHILQPAGYADEAKFKELWGLHNTGQEIQFRGNFGTPDIDIDALEASALTLGDPALTVAVIDDGVDFSHPDLAGRQWINPGESGGGKETNGQDDDGNGYVDDVNGWDFVNDDRTVHDSDDDHGTHVAGTIAANLNGLGIVGVAPNVKIMALKFLGPTGGQTSDAIAAIGYAAAKGISISNNSWGSISCNPALKEAIAAAEDMLFVAAAGNGGPDGQRDNNDIAPFYPASYDVPTIVSVAAIDKDGALGDFSNWGYRNVDVGAPGVEIYSTIPGGGYDWWPGTSMASPHVAGVAALARSVNPSLTTAQLRQVILDTGTPLPSLRDRTATGDLVNAKAAVDRALELAEEAPTVSIADLSRAEGSPSGTTDFDFTVSISAAHSSPVTVRYDTAPGTTDPATAGADYTAVVDGLVTIPAGQTSGTARVVVHRDTADEADETFAVTLSDPTDATIADGTATGTILDDDVPPPADDQTAPQVQAPAAAVRATSIGSKVPVGVSWPAATDDSAIERYQLQQSTNGGSWVNVALASPTALEATVNLAPGTTYRFRVRAFDTAGNLSAWATGASFTVGLLQEDAAGLAYSGTWTRAPLAGASGGSVMHANGAGATVSHTFTGRGVALVMDEAPNRGIAEVRLDGTLVATLDLYDADTLVRRVLYTTSFAGVGTHTVELRVTGTRNPLSTSRRVDLDAVVVLQ